MSDTDAEDKLAGFLAKFTPEISALATSAVATMRARLPGATVMVYDNYNALAVGFGPNERASQAVLSIAVFHRGVALCLIRGVGLPDPHKILKGGGNQVRNVTLDTAERLDDPRVVDIIDAALRASSTPIPSAGGRLIVKSISVKQRPRRPPLIPAGSAPRRRR
ncbi:MAG: hypothetical protein M3T55_07835 [Pseudomonadota bacterium]|nr:hypothetical protein [Pseudomonadota bacterium]